jgi:DNA modification methylase
MKVHAYKKVELSKLRPWDGNPRLHSPEQIAQIAASMQEFGFTNPLLIDEKGLLIAGHGRLQALQALGQKSAGAIEVKGLSKAQKTALLVADNKLALNASWDMAALSSILSELDHANFQMDLTGFTAPEIESILTWSPDGIQGGKTDPDAVPPAPETAVSKLGDIWLCGKHRIACGDCTDSQLVAKLLQGGIKPQLMVTDPPYGVEYDPDWRNNSVRNNGKKIGGRAIGKVKNDHQADWRGAWVLFPGDVAYVWHSGLHSAEVAESLHAANFELRSQIIWAKNNLAISRGHYHWQHEPCWYAVRKGGQGQWAGDRKQTTLWEIDKPMKSETGHSTQKPVECMRRPIANNSNPGMAVYDPFLGSGTTVIAAHQMQRTCLGVELNPSYVDVAVLRWQDFAGAVAKREKDGVSFADAQVARAKQGA